MKYKLNTNVLYVNNNNQLKRGDIYKILNYVLFKKYIITDEESNNVSIITSKYIIE